MPSVSISAAPTTLLTTARRAAAEASAITPTVDGWLALAEAEYRRAHGTEHARRVGKRRNDLGSPRASSPRRLLPVA